MLIHADLVRRVHDRQPQPGRVMARQLGPQSIFGPHQHNLDAKLARGLHRPRDRLLGRVIAADRIQHDLHKPPPPLRALRPEPRNFLLGHGLVQLSKQGRRLPQHLSGR